MVKLYCVWFLTNNLSPRVCRTCGTQFIGGPRAFYCPDCREERKKKQIKEYRQRKKAGIVREIGSISLCEICGAEYVVAGGKHRFCEKCSLPHLKEVDNKQSLLWKANNPEKIREGKRALSKKRHSADGKTSGIKYIIWDKGHMKWKVVPYVNGKQIRLGYFSSLSEAEKELNKFLKDKTTS